MPNTTSPRHNSGFQYRLRFFHRCRSPISQCCDPGQIDRFQIQGSAIESTCGSPIVVALVRYKHDPESGLSRECQRAQFAPGAASFAIKAIVVPSGQVLSYMDQPLLQQPRLVDSKGRNLIEGPDVSPDGCIYATPLEKNGIAHLNNFCIMYPYTGGQVPGAFSGTGYSLGHQPPPAPVSKRKTSGGGGSRGKQHSPTSTRRVRGMVKGGGDAARLGGATEILQDSADVLHSNGELCLLVQLLRRDAQRPGRWYAYHIPHLISRPFQVVPQKALLASVQSSPAPPCLATAPPLMAASRIVTQQQKQEQEKHPSQPLMVQGCDFGLPRHSVAAPGFLGVSDPQLLVQPHRFMSPQPQRHMDSSAATTDFEGAVAMSDLRMYGTSGPTGFFPGDEMGLMEAPFSMIKQQPSQHLELPTGFIFGCSEPIIGLSGTRSIDRMGMSGGGMCITGTLQGTSSMAGPLTVGGGSGGGAVGVAVGVGGFGAERGLSSLSADSPSGAGSHRVLRARRRSLLSKDSSHDDNSVGGAPMSTSGVTATGLSALRTPSVTSAMDPNVNGLRAAALMTAAAAPAAPSPPYSPQQRILNAVSLGSAMEMERNQSLRRSDEGRSLPLPLQLRQAPSATLLEMNISDLLSDIHTQPLLTSEMMDLEEGAAKRVRSNTTTTSDVAAFMSDNNTNSNSGQIFGSPTGAHLLSAIESTVEASLGGTCGGEDRGCVGPNRDQAAFDIQLSRSDCWTTEKHFEQMMNLRKQVGACDAVNHGPGAAAAAAGGGGGGGGLGNNSRGSSASQLDLLIQMLTHQDGMEDEEQELLRPHQQQQELHVLSDAIPVPTCSVGDDMQL
ncbi:hypothetical protein VaNZ11_005874 [Volvox africanus]|uniref:RHD domain-containing protein n=1 Tax=Volvox africanus TaxID=51714 RepID=A0ABQ5RZW3_9CHLO|nr:hypothetical protein VaNZ11_005874 [Volvox africanus]